LHDYDALVDAYNSGENHWNLLCLFLKITLLRLQEKLLKFADKIKKNLFILQFIHPFSSYL